MLEFRKMMDIPPIKIGIDDLKELVSVMGKEMSPSFECEFSADYGDSMAKGSTLDSIFPHGMQTIPTSITINIFDYSDANPDRNGITVEMKRNFAYGYLHSQSEIWFKGKLQQLTDFFRAHRPWYAGLHYKFPFWNGALTALSWTSLLVAAFFDRYWNMVFAGISLYFLSVSFSKFQDGALFPLITFNFRERDRKNINYQLIGCLIGLGSLLVGLTGLLLSIGKGK